ncbi:hypothetical protein DUZ99_11805 [Xylanibacillus composti]|uniref:Uncharacterized protein n=1 Tax=Xylanibacillus composti TaxID=1572762 RepID=A0A8J4GYV8_9BACL|nr:hypothetical protein [Xylanibacillus composti]MDT9725658.1 hypothetical protein [Xylanibacillus composti]GIQ67753.1 hypothetical protein XYCOK13_05770 [Xylanibacillus composti]
MLHDFLKIKSIAGELKLSHKKREFGITISTEELIVQKPHVNYHVRLADITQILPYRPVKGLNPFAQMRKDLDGRAVTAVYEGGEHYTFHVSRATMHNRSGIFNLGACRIIIPVKPEYLKAIGKYAGLHAI